MKLQQDELYKKLDSLELKERQIIKINKGMDKKMEDRELIEKCINYFKEEYKIYISDYH